MRKPCDTQCVQGKQRQLGPAPQAGMPAAALPCLEGDWMLVLNRQPYAILQQMQHN